MFTKLYFIALPLLLVLDAIWLGVIAKSFYRKQIGFLMAESVQWPVALLFYFLYAVGLVFFVVYPAWEKQDWRYALFAGMLFGFIVYAAYDLTNLATLKHWPVAVTVVDLFWGMILSGAVSLISFNIAGKLGR